jgi:hypothetical protein
MLFKTRKIRELEKRIQELEKEIRNQKTKHEDSGKWITLPEPLSKYEINENDELRNKDSKKILKKRIRKNQYRKDTVYFDIELRHARNMRKHITISLEKIKEMIRKSTNTSDIKKSDEWKRIPEPFTSYQIRKDKKVRNAKTEYILKPMRKNGNLYLTLVKDNGYQTTVKINILYNMAYKNKKYKSRKKHYKSGQIALPF